MDPRDNGNQVPGNGDDLGVGCMSSAGAGDSPADLDIQDVLCNFNHGSGTGVSQCHRFV